MENLISEIKQMAKEQDAVILAHYYVDGDIQDIADYVGDSYYLAKVAREVPNKTIVFCGVTFMGESACILNPDKTILIPDANAVCPMAIMVERAKIQEMRDKYEDLAKLCILSGDNKTASKCYERALDCRRRAAEIAEADRDLGIVFLISPELRPEDLGYTKASLKEIAAKHNRGFYLNLIDNLPIESQEKKRLLRDADIEEAEYEEINEE